jgi:choline dehydrogenase-like flavoprotein
MHDAIVVGSGAAGTWAAHQLAMEGRSVLVLDVGFKPAPQPPLSEPFVKLRRGSPQGHGLLGDRFESLANVVGPYQSPKLNAPRFRFVTHRSEELGPIRSTVATMTQSFAYGGLANAWGAGTYRFTGDDLRHFPLPPGALDPYYDVLTRAIGISGTGDDDLAAHFGSAEGLQPPLRLDRLAAYALSGYERRRDRFRAAGFTLGRTRLAVLSERLNDRDACAYDNLAFWEPRVKYVYVPGWTLDALIARRAIEYRDQQLVVRFRERVDGVDVVARDLTSGVENVYSAARLVLAAGALNSARLALRSFDDSDTELPLLDNLPSMVPFVAPRFIGDMLDLSAHGLGQLNVVFKDGDADYLQGTFHSYTALLAGEVIMEFPLPTRGTVAASKFVLPGLSVVTFFYPSEPHPQNHVRMDSDGTLVVTYDTSPPTGLAEGRLIALMRGCGFWSHPALCRVSPRGAGIHYAGTLPMSREAGRPYTTDVSGRLQQCRHVYVADAAVFPFLPGKNHTFTVMANAMRVGREVAASLDRR